jgi:hypothetical protein
MEMIKKLTLGLALLAMAPSAEAFSLPANVTKTKIGSYAALVFFLRMTLKDKNREVRYNGDLSVTNAFYLFDDGFLGHAGKDGKQKNLTEWSESIDPIGICGNGFSFAKKLSGIIKDYKELLAATAVAIAIYNQGFVEFTQAEILKPLK